MKYVIAGNYGAGNIGDEMILEGLLDTINDADPSAQITVLSGNPEETKRKYAVQSELKFPSGLRSIFSDMSKTKNSTSNCDFFILGGGGLFGNLKFRANLVWAAQALGAMSFQKKIICYGQSVGLIKSKFIENLVQGIFQKSELITVRDNQSKENLHNMGVTKEIYVIPDLAFKIKPQERSMSQNNVILALRQMDKLPGRFIKEIGKFSEWLINEEGKNIEAINFQKGKEGDETIHEKVLRNIEKKDKIKSIYTDDPKKIEEAFLKSEFVIGMRLHSIITAVRTATPFIALDYAEKVGGFLKYAGLEEYSLDPRDATLESLKEQYIKAKATKTSFIQKMEDFTERAYQKNQEGVELLKSTIEK